MTADQPQPISVDEIAGIYADVFAAHPPYPFFTIDHHADAAYMALTGEAARPADRTESISPSINADYDADGNVIGIEFLTLKLDLGEEFKPELKACRASDE